MITTKVASRTSPVGSSWFRDKKVSVPWKVYERARRGEVFRALDLRGCFKALNRPVQCRMFKQSFLVLLLVLKIFTSLAYRAFTSFSEALRLHELLGEDRAPSYKTINNAMDLVSEEFLCTVNMLITPKHCRLVGMDSSGLKFRRKGAWVTVRFSFKKESRKRDFNKLHLLVDLEEKKVLNCYLTEGNVSDFKGLKPPWKPSTG